ncbi:MAG TPA: hypothetical protein VHK88_13890 [Aquihabitans sp.]|nr:hypothetical protein [Aquihabitans sp.]
MTHLNQGPVAAGRVAPAARWSATDAVSARVRHHLTVIAPMPTAATYVVKPSFEGITRRPTEGSS